MTVLTIFGGPQANVFLTVDLKLVALEFRLCRLTNSGSAVSRKDYMNALVDLMEVSVHQK